MYQITRGYVCFLKELVVLRLLRNHEAWWFSMIGFWLPNRQLIWCCDAVQPRRWLGMMWTVTCPKLQWEPIDETNIHWMCKIQENQQFVSPGANRSAHEVSPQQVRVFFFRAQSPRLWWLEMWGYPQIIQFHKIFHYKPSILGYPSHLWTPPCCLVFTFPSINLVGGFIHFFIFHHIWDNPSHWLTFFKMVRTTNQV